MKTLNTNNTQNTETQEVITSRTIENDHFSIVSNGGNQTITSENNVIVEILLKDLIFKTFENTTDEIIKDLREIEIHEGGFISLRFDGIGMQEIIISGDNGIKTIERKDFKIKWGQKCELMNSLINNNIQITK